METKQDDIDCHDPVAHLNFSMQRDDDYLIRDNERTESEQPRTVESTRQVSMTVSVYIPNSISQA